jgi:hypothetical protein
MVSIRGILAFMHVARKTNQELVVVDSSIWVSVLLLCAAVAVLYASNAHGKFLQGLALAGLFALFAFLFWRKEVVVFDAGRQQADWRRRRAFKPSSGMVPFSEIAGIGMESTSADHGVPIYRLTILTSGKPVPMSDVYNSDQQRCVSIKAEILEFLHLDDEETVSAAGFAHENSIQSLLRQGRKVDAIELARTSEHIGLTEAVDLVNGIEEKRKAAK